MARDLFANAATREQWAALITEAWQGQVDSIFEAGGLLIRAKAELAHGEFEAMVRKELPFRENTAQRLMKIAKDNRLTKAAHVPLLPPSWGTLYELTKLSDSDFDYLVSEGVLHPEMERADIAAALNPDPDDGSAGFYGDERRVRKNESWDTLDGRLVPALLEGEPSFRNAAIWEPAAGAGFMVAQLQVAGCQVVRMTDIEPRADYIGQLDFFAVTEWPENVGAIVTNPPWGRLLAPFARHAVNLAQSAEAMVALLVPLPWITAATIADLTERLSGLVVPRFRARWMTDEEEEALASGAAAPKMNHVWVVWDFSRDPRGLLVSFVNAPNELAREPQGEAV